MNSEDNINNNRFSETASKIMVEAKMLAESLGSGVTTNHILASLASTPGTIAYEALHELDVTPERVSFILSAHLENQDMPAISLELKQALKLSYKLAHLYGSPTVDCEHLLLAIVSRKESQAFLTLQNLGVASSSLKKQLEEYFHALRLSRQAEALENSASNTNEPMDLNDQGDDPLNRFGPDPGARSTSQKTKSALDYFTTDLTKLAKNKKLDTVIGRDAEIQRMIQILVRRQKNNPVLTGEPGVGKTAIVEGLASRIASGNVPVQLADKRILNLDLALLISGTTYRGQFEERTKKLMEEVLRAGDVILFVDEIHTIVGAGAAEGSIDLSNILKPALVKGQMKLIGATTNEEYRKYVEKDPALERRMQRINVEEPTIEETIKILTGLKRSYEKHHQVKISDDAIVAASELAKRYINDRFMPDKAIDLIDEAAAALQIEKPNSSVKLADLEKRAAQAKREHQMAADNLEYEKAADWRVLELRLQNQIKLLRSQDRGSKNEKIVDRHEVAKVVSQWTGIPMSSLERSDRIKLVDLNKTLKNFIIGQDEAIETISAAVKRSTAGVSDPARPLGSFIFLGPTGVGKTELARVLAREVFGRDEALIKLDMSEFMERHNISRLVGAPPGYVGYDEAGKLTEQIRRQPYSVVLLDEIEKAHPDVFNMLLQIMEDGYLTDAKGRRVNFRNTILIMTSNIGMAELNQASEIGFRTKRESDLEKRYLELKGNILEKVKQNFRPEFINRLDKIIVFRPLGSSEITLIVKQHIEALKKRLGKEGIELEIEPAALELIATKGYEPEFGARPIRRVVRDLIETPLSDLILSKKFTSDLKVIRVGRKKSELTLSLVLPSKIASKS